MGYCEVDDIRADFKGIEINSTDSAVLESEVEDIIEQESAYIDSRVGVKYVTPIESSPYPEAFLLLKRICIFRVSDRVRNVIEIKTGQTQKDSDEKAKENSARQYNKDLADIAKGLMVLKDVPLLNSTGSVSSFNVDCDVQQVFNVNKQQW